MSNCRVCGQPPTQDGKETHTPETTQHVFSEDGKLMSWADKAKTQRPAPTVTQGGDLGPMSRLLEVLLERAVITPEDTLYIVTGQRTRTSPKMPEPPC